MLLSQLAGEKTEILHFIVSINSQIQIICSSFRNIQFTPDKLSLLTEYYKSRPLVFFIIVILWLILWFRHLSLQHWISEKEECHSSNSLTPILFAFKLITDWLAFCTYSDCWISLTWAYKIFRNNLRFYKAHPIWKTHFLFCGHVDVFSAFVNCSWVIGDWGRKNQLYVKKKNQVSLNLY